MLVLRKVRVRGAEVCISLMLRAIHLGTCSKFAEVMPVEVKQIHVWVQSSQTHLIAHSQMLTQMNSVATAHV